MCWIQLCLFSLPIFNLEAPCKPRLPGISCPFFGLSSCCRFWLSFLSPTPCPGISSSCMVAGGIPDNLHQVLGLFSMNLLTASIASRGRSHFYGFHLRYCFGSSVTYSLGPNHVFPPALARTCQTRSCPIAFGPYPLAQMSLHQISKDFALPPPVGFSIIHFLFISGVAREHLGVAGFFFN